MRRSLLWSLVFVTASCAPAASVPAPPQPKPVAVAVPPTPVGPQARWVFDSEHPDVANELDLGDGTVLQVSVRGRRWRMPRDKARAVEHSELVLPEDVRDVRREGDRYLFVGSRGGTFISDGPLTMATRVGKSLDFSAEFAAGRRALLGVQPDGTLHRTQDLGATWAKSKLALRPGEVVAGIAANTRGEAIVLLRPQRVLHSTDDGATWSSLGTPGIGAGDVTRDAKGDLWLLGAMIEKQAKLAQGPARFEVVTGYTGRLSRHKKGAGDAEGDEGVEREDSDERTLVGDRVVRVKTKRKSGMERDISISVSPLRGKPATWQQLTDAATADRVSLGGYENIVVATWQDDPKSQAISVARTTDEGKTWEPLGRIENPGTYSPRVHVLPGWTAVTGSCRRQQPCESARFKADGGEWQAMGIASDAFVKHVLYDKAHERVLALAESPNRTWTLYAGKRDAALQRVDLKFGRGDVMTAAIDDTGTLRVVIQDQSSPAPRIEKITGDLKFAPPIYPPFDAEHIELVGARGLAYTKDRAWETADGGEHWTATGVGGGPAECGPSGCMVEGTVRVGWDLPDPAKPLIASTATPPARDPASRPTKPAATAGSIAVSCKATGGWKPYAGEPSGAFVALDGGARLAARVFGNGADEPYAFRLLGAAPSPQLVTLSSAAKPNSTMTSVYTDRTYASGMVTVRASYVSAISGSRGPDKKYNPVDVELAWHSLATGKTQKVSLSKVSPFRVGSAELGAMTAIVDGGLLFLANSGDSPLYFVRDNGKVETLPRPVGVRGGFESAVRVGEQIILAQAGHQDIALVSTTDAGKTWATTVWSFADGAGLVMVDAQPAIALYDAGKVVGVVPFASITNDPPAAVRVSLPIELLSSSHKLVACPPAPTRGVRTEIEEDDNASSVVATVTGASKSPMSIKTTAGFGRVRADGSACTDVVVAAGDDATLYLTPADPTHAWLVRSGSNLRTGNRDERATAPKFEAAAATCTLP